MAATRLMVPEEQLRAAGWSGAVSSAAERLGEKRQALVHPVLDTAVVFGELLVAMRQWRALLAAARTWCAMEQIELILLAAIDVVRLQRPKIVRLGFDRHDRVVPQPIRPAFLDNLAVSNVTGSGMPRNWVGSGSQLAAIANALTPCRTPRDGFCCHQRSMEFSAPASVAPGPPACRADSTARSPYQPSV
jgi:hypothetical protein